LSSAELATTDYTSRKVHDRLASLQAFVDGIQRLLGACTATVFAWSFVTLRVRRGHEASIKAFGSQRQIGDLLATICGKVIRPWQTLVLVIGLLIATRTLPCAVNERLLLIP